MRISFGQMMSALFGDARRVTLEQRLFNIIALVNATTNVGGAFALVSLKSSGLLIVLQLSTGALFFLFYCLSRSGAAHRRLYWPFVLLILLFLSANTLGNAGSVGGAHYYLVPALVIAVVLSDSRRRTLTAVAVFGAATLALLLLEHQRPELFTPYADSRERFYDVTGNFIFVQVFTAALVAVLSGGLNQERRRTDTCGATRSTRRAAWSRPARPAASTSRARPTSWCAMLSSLSTEDVSRRRARARSRCSSSRARVWRGQNRRNRM